MKIIQVNLAIPLKVDFEPQNDLVEIAQNVYTLLSTDKYTVPLKRSFGLTSTVIDQPINMVQAKLRAEIMDVIARWEPRFIVQEIDFSKSTNLKEGVLYPVVRGGINGV